MLANNWMYVGLKPPGNLGCVGHIITLKKYEVVRQAFTCCNKTHGMWLGIKRSASEVKNREYVGRDSHEFDMSMVVHYTKRKTKRPHNLVHTNANNKKVTEENEIASELEFLRKQNIELMRLVEKKQPSLDDVSIDGGNLSTPEVSKVATPIEPIIVSQVCFTFIQATNTNSCCTYL